MTLKEKFESKYRNLNKEPEILIVVISLPSGAKEVISNSSDLDNKVHYYLETYDKFFRHNRDHNVKIIDFILV
ncbi:hypothetical protein CPT_MarsHill_078 [Staphylococcus phage MarsHill]|nr:hypothetical protein CPT_MarsHill_078 [Staphylococcus phage MarsHill]QQO92733.1 hypothetical protein CPT_Madawaska_078 [Staphylococcus phage Madawaska]